MTESELLDTARACSETHGNRLRERILLSLVLCTLIRTGHALAGEPAPGGTGAEQRSDAAPAPRESPGALRPDVPNFRPPTLSLAPPPFSATEFRPRAHAPDGQTVHEPNFAFDTPMLKSNSVWEHMAEAKSQDRVRLLTLWETRGSTLSLQTKRGSPSLQWSSPWMMHSSSGRGLFDELLSVPSRGIGAAPHSGGSRPTTPVPAIKSLEFPGPIGTK